MAELSAFLLAGGRSSRMGADKAFLELEGQTLLARGLGVLCAVTPQVTIVGPASRFASYAPVVEDVYAGRGPLAGIQAALAASTSDLNLVLAVDLPFVSAALLLFLAQQARACQALVTVPHIAGGFQPLCAVYRRGFEPLARAALQAGNNKIDALFSAAQTRIIDEAELSPFDFTAAMFENLNTPEDFRKATQGKP